MSIHPIYSLFWTLKDQVNILGTWPIFLWEFFQNVMFLTRSITDKILYMEKLCKQWRTIQNKVSRYQEAAVRLLTIIRTCCSTRRGMQLPTPVLHHGTTNKQTKKAFSKYRELHSDGNKIWRPHSFKKLLLASGSHMFLFQFPAIFLTIPPTMSWPTCWSKKPTQKIQISSKWIPMTN